MSVAAHRWDAAPDKRKAHTTVVVTGFGPFPGVPVNATMRLVPELAQVALSAFPDVRIVTEVLATEWLSAPQRLERLLADIAPDIVLHFGVSSRARGFEIETRARNICQASPDATGVLPPAPAVRPGGADAMAASLPVQHLVARLRRRGIAAFVSRNAGAYLCNALLYHSLCCAGRAPGRRVGFIHIPASLARPGGANRGRSGACPLTWPETIAGSLEIVAGCLGRNVPLRASAALRST
ncbi:MAG: pyroglutamyl-peptidase I [Hyphomicrobiaceae bacterium]|nr:MAG: pyroglutamyl-peptidase I [Hyphomicrobiaceae bacterium]